VKELRCRDAGTDCDFVARGATEDEIIQQAKEHAQTVHDITATPELIAMVGMLIRDV